MTSNGVEDWTQINASASHNLTRASHDRNEQASLLDSTFSPVHDHEKPSSGEPNCLKTRITSVVSEVTSAKTHQFDRIPLDLMVKWPDTILPEPISSVREFVKIRPVSSLGRLMSIGPWNILKCTLDGEPFAVIFETELLNLIAKHSDLKLEVLPQDPKDLIIVTQYLLSGLISTIQAGTGKRVDLISQETCVSVPNYSWLCMKVTTDDYSGDIGFASSSSILALLGQFVSTNSFPLERHVSDSLSVRVGPIKLPYMESHKISSGDVVETGIDPNGEVHGILERSDKRYWPILIDDESVTILDGLQEPASSAVGNGSILSSLKIGTIELSASQRVRLKKADVMPVTRIADNGAVLVLGNREHGFGTLDVNNGMLVISMETVGANR